MNPANRVGGGQGPIVPGPPPDKKPDSPQASTRSIKGPFADMRRTARPVAAVVSAAAAAAVASARQSPVLAKASGRLNAAAQRGLTAASHAPVLQRVPGGARISTALTQAADKAAVARAMGPNLKVLLGNINPLDAAINEHQRAQMLNAIRTLDLKVELARVDKNGEVSPADNEVIEQIYINSFPAAERIPVATIHAAMADRQVNGTEFDGRHFTLCYTGKLPGETSRRPLAFTQGGTLDAGENGMVGFAEYLAVHEDGRRMGLLHVMLGFVNASARSAVAQHNRTTGERKAMLGAVWTIDPVGLGQTPTDRRDTVELSRINDRVGAQVVMGERRSDKRVIPVHARPDVTPHGDTGNLPRHFVYRPNPGSPAFGKDELLAISDSYDDYLRGWAATGQRGVDDARIVGAAEYRAEQHAKFDTVVFITPSKAPSAWDMARDDQLNARTVAEKFGLLSEFAPPPVTEADFANVAFRHRIADLAAAAFAAE